MRHTAQELEVPDLGHESTILPVPVRPVGSWTEASFQSVDSDCGGRSLARRLCETRSEKLKSETGRAESGEGLRFSERGSKA